MQLKYQYRPGVPKRTVSVEDPFECCMREGKKEISNQYFLLYNLFEFSMYFFPQSNGRKRNRTK